MQCNLFEPTKYDENGRVLFKKHERFIFDVRTDRLKLFHENKSDELKAFDKHREKIIVRYCDKKFHYKDNGIDVPTVYAKCPMLTGIAITEKIEEVKQITKRIMTFDNFEGRKDLVDYLLGFMGNIETQTVIIKSGVGTGKTHLARSLQINEIEKGKNVEFIMSEDLAKIFMEYETWNNDKLGKLEAKKKYNSMMNSDLLIIDDLGSEKISKTDHFGTQFLILLEKRKGKLMITTNLNSISPKKFDEIYNEDRYKYLNNRYDERIMSRILEKSCSFKLSGKDRRLK